MLPSLLPLTSVASSLCHSYDIRLELRAAVADLSARGLKLAAKWAAEQLGGVR